MKKILLLLISGCTDPGTWGICEITARGDAEFEANVALAAQRWDEALYPRCGRPVLVLTEQGGHPVRDYAEADWPGDPNELGLFDGDQIGARSQAVGDGIINLLLHEMGHSFGLEHNREPWSVMWPVVVVPYDRPSPNDVIRAAHVLGCE
jgi:hypothetical protein